MKSTKFFLFKPFCTTALLSLLGLLLEIHQNVSLFCILSTFATAPPPALTIYNALSYLFLFKFS